jgi:uncharacterized protein with HEPN domain
MSERDVLYLEHILEAIAAIERYTAGGRTAFFADDMIQSAVIRQLEVVGEAVKNLSDDLVSREPRMPWREAARTRDLLIHGYFRIDLEIVWNIVAHELTPLRENIRRILNASR